MKRILGDVGRLISFLDVLQYAGDQLYKRSLRYTGLTAVVSMLGFLGGLLPGIDTYSAGVALALPLAVGGSMLTGGVLLRTIPNLVAARAINAAAAGDLDLMEDYRKARQDEHLKWLWQRVFRHEWALATASSRVHVDPIEAPQDVCFPQPADDDPDRRAWAEFLARSVFALARPQPQTRQRYHLGVDLRYLEDWRNGGFFDRQDVKLLEQFDGSPTLEAIRRQSDYGGWDHLSDLLWKTYLRFWHFMITRAVAIQVGVTLMWFNRRFETDLFNAQALLWPGEDEQPWLAPFPLASHDLHQRRLLFLRRIFGDTDDQAERLLRRMLVPGYWIATKLRARFDPEYLEGLLGFSAGNDARSVGLLPPQVAWLEKLALEAAADRATLLPWLARYRPELLTPACGEDCRAARIAIHLERKALRGWLRGDPASSAVQEKFVVHVLPAVDRAVRDRVQYTDRLVALRVHHELWRLHHGEYSRLLTALRFEPPGEPPAAGSAGGGC
jgi:hypothetical protein